MSINNYMHPRNIYKIPPNFKQLAIDFPEFRKYVQQDLSGKVSLDFKNNEALHALTVTLLKKDFGLQVDIPLNRLIPTVPLRLNYVLWMEDLVSLLENKDTVQGIDIGTGASCIYALLLAKMRGWHTIATDIDDDNLKYAQANVVHNNLQHLINVKKVSENTLLSEVVDDRQFDFCMCNPPFFGSVSDLDPKHRARTNHRKPPRNAFTGERVEVIAKGGEVEFITRLIDESCNLKGQVRIYSTMVGCKSSLPPLKAHLREVGASHFVQTSFCQGHTMRWGLAWTFCDLDLRKATTVLCTAKKTQRPPLRHVIPEGVSHGSIDVTVALVKDLLGALQMEFEEVKHDHEVWGAQARAKFNTWSHQRRKRRQQKQQPSPHNDCHVPMDVDDLAKRSPGKREREEEEQDENDSSRDEDVETKRLRCDGANTQAVLLQVMLVVRIAVNDQVVLEMSWMDGTASKEQMHQVMQYFKNNLK